MPFYSNEDEGTPCPVRTFSPNPDFISGRWPTSGRPTAFPLVSGDDDETVEIELTTVLPSINTFLSRRKTILNAPPRRPGQASRQKEEHQQGHRESRVELEGFFDIPPPPILPPQQPEPPVVEPADVPDITAALQLQPTQSRRVTRGAALSQQPRRPTVTTDGRKGGRRLSAWVEAKVQEKRNQRIAAQQGQNEHNPQPSLDVSRMLGPTNLSGGKSRMSPPEDNQLAKSYLNAPPKRSLGQTYAKGAAGRGKENVLPGWAVHYEEERPIHPIVLPPTKALEEQGNGGGGARENKRPVSMENAVNKRSKFSTESEFKRSSNPAPRHQSYPPATADYGEMERGSVSKKRPSSPQPKYVSESDLEDDQSNDAICNPLIQPSYGSNSTWDQSPARGTSKLKLMKRRKVSDDSNGEEVTLNPAQISLAEQLAARQRKDGHKDAQSIRPTSAPSAATLNALNPVLSDNLAQSEMYEDSWLSMLEASVTQLVNAIFSTYAASQASTIETHIELRREMIALYSAFFPLHKRIQASLAFGALSVPKDSILKSSAAKAWAEDIGLKRKFIELFMNTYEVEVLGVAMEAVIGRELFGKSGQRLSDAQIIEEGSSILSMQEKEKMKLVERFLERFLVNCEDAYLNPPRSRLSTSRIIGAFGIGKMKGAAVGRAAAMEDDWGSVAWGLRKTILRALMLILLMDKTKQGAKNLLGARCLFKPVNLPPFFNSCMSRLLTFMQMSAYKSSVSVLHALARLLLPSLGDIVRPLSLMGYTLEHSQHPLEEFEYIVQNLAVDMRDGVRLVRLVELLLYPTEVQLSHKTGIWPLSQELKYPAISRAHKLNNIGIALETLEDAGGNEGSVKAEDVANGFRERTVGLLWGIVGRWGLEMGVGGLVDWSELRKEIRRLKKDRIKAAGVGSISDEDEEEGEERGYVALLKCWAKCIADKRGLHVENLTTSFADGKVFEAIIEQYEGFFPTKIQGTQGLKLEARLRELGCSSYFGMYKSINCL